MSHFKYDDFIRVLDIVNRCASGITHSVLNSCSLFSTLLHYSLDYTLNSVVFVHVYSLISIGVEFCGEGSESLQESMRQQSLNYFWNYHRYDIFLTQNCHSLTAPTKFCVCSKYLEQDWKS